MSLVKVVAALGASVFLSGCIIMVPGKPHIVGEDHRSSSGKVALGPIPENCPTPARSATDAAKMLAMVNAERAARNLPALRMSEKLASIAHAHACDNAARMSFSHEGSDGSDLLVRLQRNGYRVTAAAENTGLGFDNPEKMMAFWMGSPGHHANILHPKVTELGLGQADGARPTWVLNLGRSR